MSSYDSTADIAASVGRAYRDLRFQEIREIHYYTEGESEKEPLWPLAHPGVCDQLSWGLEFVTATEDIFHVFWDYRFNGNDYGLFLCPGRLPDRAEEQVHPIIHIDMSHTARWHPFLNQAIERIDIYMHEANQEGSYLYDGDLNPFSVPKDIVFHFQGNRRLYVCGATYFSDTNVARGNDTFLVVFDDVVAKRLRLGPFAS